MNNPKICAALVTVDVNAARSVASMVDFFEVRIDLIGNTWKKLAQSLEKPWIATNRVTAEGGAWKGEESDRIEILFEAIELGASLVDIEVNTDTIGSIVPDIRKKAGCILSHHNLVETPSLDKMKEIIEKQVEAGADICKLVTTATSYEDNLRILKLIKEFPEQKIVAFCMGPAGQTSRILSPLIGGYFTFGSVSEGKESAPGQVSVSQMTDTWKMMGISCQ